MLFMPGNLARAILAVLLCLPVLGTARAEQRELALGLQPAYGLTYIDERSPSGGGGILHASYGLTDAVSLQIMGGATAHPLAAVMDDMTMKTLPAGTLLTWQVSAGVAYALDIVRIVPFFEASLGVLGTYTRTSAGVQSKLNAGAAIGLGADYLISRRWAVGVAIRYHAFLTDLGRIPIYLTAGPRVVVRFGL
jgi:hypothetical protein